MDSVASDWFWFWLPLLVVVVVVRALAVPSSLLVSWSSLTSLSHHTMSEIIQAQRRSPRIPIEMLLPGSDDIFASESPQPQSYVGWAPPSLPLRAPASS